MADEYVVRIVLDGIDNASDDVDRVEDKVGGLTSTITEADSRMLMMAGSAAAVAGGLNQMTGGLRKALSAARELDYINDKTYERMNTQILKFEIISGVMEFLASTFIVLGMGSMFVSKTLGPFIKRGMASAKTLRGMGLAAGTVVGFMGSMVAIIGVLLFLFIAFDDEIKAVLMRMHKFGEETDFANRALTGLIDRVNGFKDAVGRLGDDVMDNMTSKYRGQYAGGGRLA
jgi:methyl-accepting chemotaxis protein